MAFRTHYSFFEFIVMPFGIRNTSATCQYFINYILQEVLDIFSVIYLDNILIYSKWRTEYQEQVYKVLAKLSDAGLFIKLEKYEFSITKATFFGFVISSDSIKIDPEKVKSVIEWETPRSIKDIECFLRFANFY